MGCKLLILADDFTGALDTAASLAREGVPVTASTDISLSPETLDTPVLVLDTESRHLTAEEAYKIYKSTCVRWSAVAEFVYVKTDSVLRGNLSSYFAGAVDGLAEHPALYFLPAFPAAGRTTENGRQLLGGVPLEKTSFAADPLNPVRESRISRLVSQPYQAQVREYPLECPIDDFATGGRKIAVFDAGTQEHLAVRGWQLKEKGLLRLTAGCAGFAGCFPELLDLPAEKKPLPGFSSLLVLCGSANEITFRQLAEAERNGWSIISPEKNALLGGHPETAAAQLKKQLAEQGRALFAVSRRQEDVKEYTAFCREKGMSPQEIHETIQNYLRRLAVLLVQTEETAPDALAVFGGDTLFTVLETLGGGTLTVLGEVEPGVPVSRTVLFGRMTILISKSGGLGSPDILCRIQALQAGGKTV